MLRLHKIEKFVRAKGDNNFTLEKSPIWTDEVIKKWRP